MVWKIGAILPVRLVLSRIESSARFPRASPGFDPSCRDELGGLSRNSLGSRRRLADVLNMLGPFFVVVDFLDPTPASPARRPLA